MGIGPRKEHHRWLFLRRALEIVKHIVRSNVGIDFAYPGQQQDIELLVGKTRADFRDPMGFGIQNTLQELCPLILQLPRNFCASPVKRRGSLGSPSRIFAKTWLDTLAPWIRPS